MKFYDPRCLDLARHFYPNAPAEVLDDIASDLQEIIEDYTDLPLPNGETLQAHEDRVMFEPRQEAR